MERITDPLEIGHRALGEIFTKDGCGKVATTTVPATDNETEIGSATGGMESGMTETGTIVLRETVQTGIGMITAGILVEVGLARGRHICHIDLRRRVEKIPTDVLVLGRENIP